MASQEQLRKFEEFFEQADTDGSGWLSIEELGVALRKGGFDDKLIAKIFHELDKNKDNRVTKAEYMSELMKLHPSQVDEVRLRKAFKAIDQDGSGKIDVKELKQVMVNAGKTVDDQTLQDIIKSCDKDGDGEINIEEFIAAFRS